MSQPIRVEGANLPGPYEEPRYFSGKDVVVPNTPESNTSNNNVLYYNL